MMTCFSKEINFYMIEIDHVDRLEEVEAFIQQFQSKSIYAY